MALDPESPHLAVILAAGRGLRLRGRTRTRPKGLVNVGGVIPVVRSVEMLRNAGVRSILIGTGHLAEVYANRFRGDADVECVRCERYETAGSLYTLYNLRRHIAEDFFLLESDLLYERAALDALVGDPRMDLILGSGPTRAGDEVFIETDRSGSLVALSKDPSELSRIDAELVGISKLSFELAEQLFRSCEQVLPRRPTLDYEIGLALLAEHRPIGVVRSDDLVWCEIDDEYHYRRAVSKILPRIEARERRS